MIEVLGRRNSLNVQKVMWTLGELELDYVRHNVAGSFGFPADYDAINPTRLVPTLRDGDVTVWESNACVRYLARTYGEGGLWPAEPARLAKADQWMDWQRGDIYHHFIRTFWHLVRTDPAQRDAKKIANGATRAGQAFQLLDRHLASTAFVAGEQFSMGDIPLGAMCYRYFKIDIQRPALPNIERWYAELSDRPAYQKHVAIWPGRNPLEWAEQEEKNAPIQ